MRKYGKQWVHASLHVGWFLDLCTDHCICMGQKQIKKCSLKDNVSTSIIEVTEIIARLIK